METPVDGRPAISLGVIGPEPEGDGASVVISVNVYDVKNHGKLSTKRHSYQLLEKGCQHGYHSIYQGLDYQVLKSLVILPYEE